jgi:hypothetical protein
MADEWAEGGLIHSGRNTSVARGSNDGLFQEKAATTNKRTLLAHAQPAT